VQQQQQASAYSVRNGVERAPRLTLTPIRCQKSTGQQAAAPPGGIIPEYPGGFAGIRIDVAIERLDERDALT